MSLKWFPKDPPDPVKDPEIDYRLNVLGPPVAPLDDLKGKPRPDAADGDAAALDDDAGWWLASLELEDDRTLGWLMANVQWFRTGKVVVPREYLDAERDNAPDDEVRAVTVIARRSFLNAANRLADPDAPTGVRRIVLAGEAPEQTVRYFLSETPLDLGDAEAPTGAGTVINAVIDNGMAIGHNLFRLADGAGVLNRSRVEFFWNMDADTPAKSHWRASELDAALGANIHDGQLDDAAFYHQIGLLDWTRRDAALVAQRVTHGTHVMGLATGFEAGDAATAENRPIIAVQLPTHLVRTVSGKTLWPSIQQALQYIKRAVRKFQLLAGGKRPPVVVNFSFGDFSGPHDGTGVISQGIDHILPSTDRNARAILLPTGNGNLARCHAQLTLTKAAPRVLDWRLQPEDLTHSSVDIWLPKLDAGVPENLLCLTIRHPAVENTATVCSRPGDSAELRSDGQVVGTASYVQPFAPTHRGRFTVTLHPTATLAHFRHLAPSGIWNLELTLIGADELAVEAWIQRDETLPGHPTYGRQSFFDMASYAQFDRPGLAISPFDAPALIGKTLSYDPPGAGPVLRRNAQNGFACGGRPAVIAGYVREGRRIAPYSAGGPVANPGIRECGPDAAAPSDDTPVLAGVLSAGSSSGSMVALNGTSVAAPQVARWLSGRIGPAQFDGRQLVRDGAAIAESGPSVPGIRKGKGRVLGEPPVFLPRRRPAP